MQSRELLPAEDAASDLPAGISAKSLRWKTCFFLAAMILSNLFGDICLRIGLRNAGNLLGQSLTVYFGAFFNPWVAAGMAFFLIWLLTQMALFSWADLSYVIPITSLGYALAAIAGKVILDEVISTIRWIGISLIVIGIALVSRTSANTRS